MPWDPWAALGARPHIELRFDEVARLLGGGLYASRAGRAVIAIDPDLVGPERTAALAHELVHDERRHGDGGGRAGWVVMSLDGPEPIGGGVDGFEVLAAREEAIVGAIVADRLVPPDELDRLVDGLVGLGLGVGVDDVVEAFGVPRAVARAALEQRDLRRRR